MNVPYNFILFIGPDKTGSSWLWETMRCHPQIATPRVKELFFYDRYFSRGYEWYERQFAWDRTRTYGLDVSHDYLYDADAADRVWETLDTRVHILVGLRDPISRAYSAYRFMQSQGRIGAPVSFLNALRTVPELLDHSDYSRYLPAWLSRYENQITYMRFSSLKDEPDRLYSRIVQRIGLDPTSHVGTGSIKNEVNRARTARSPTLVRLSRAVLDLGPASWHEPCRRMDKGESECPPTVILRSAPSDQRSRSWLRGANMATWH